MGSGSFCYSLVSLLQEVRDVCEAAMTAAVAQMKQQLWSNFTSSNYVFMKVCSYLFIEALQMLVSVTVQIIIR